MAIHQAVLESGNNDAYMGETLNWTLISTYNNDEEARKRGRSYKKLLAMLPTVDHVADGSGDAEFRICSWRTNDAKNDLVLGEFVELCRLVLKHASKSP